MNTKVFLTMCVLCVTVMGVAFYKINKVDSKRWQEFANKNQCKIVEHRLASGNLLDFSGPIDIWQCADGVKYEKEAK